MIKKEFLILFEVCKIGYGIVDVVIGDMPFPVFDGVFDGGEADDDDYRSGSESNVDGFE